MAPLHSQRAKMALSPGHGVGNPDLHAKPGKICEMQSPLPAQTLSNCSGRVSTSGPIWKSWKPAAKPGPFILVQPNQPKRTPVLAFHQRPNRSLKPLIARMKEEGQNQRCRACRIPTKKEKRPRRREGVVWLPFLLFQLETTEFHRNWWVRGFPLFKTNPSPRTS